MVQTINILSNGDVKINTGSAIVESDFVYSQEVFDKIDSAISNMAAHGISELHCEKDTFRAFEHIVKGGSVSQNSFGQTISVEDFDLIMSNIIAQMAAESAATAAAEAEGASV
jgi:hypothetical protein